MLSSMIAAGAAIGLLIYGATLALDLPFGLHLLLSPFYFVLWYVLADVIATKRGY